MRYKLLQIILLIPVVLGVRIPPNPCPSIFSYFKDPRGRIYGEAVIPYDNATHMEFTVNASLVGRFKKSVSRHYLIDIDIVLMCWFQQISATA